MIKVLDQVVTMWSRVRGWFPVQMGGMAYRCDTDHYSFWKKVNAGSWEPQTFTTFDTLLTDETVYCDIGAWIGPTVLYAARRCAKVYCFEPDRVAYMHLLCNLKLNKLENVLPFNLALAADAGLSKMASPRGKRGDSMTSLLRPDGAKGMEVLCLTWENWLSLVGNPAFDVLKIDIEGGEFTFLPSIAEYLRQKRPKLYLSLHPHLLPEEKRLEEMANIVEVLQGYGSCREKNGIEISINSLLEEQAVHKAGTYLLLP